MRTINYILTLSLIFLYITTTCDAQLTNKAVPPSPNASNLGKYGDIPVGLYTGVPNISIPIWEIKERRLSLPISLSYHASGNRVDDIASWTGLGWTLNAGGVITRTVKGFPDDVVNGYRYINSAMGIYFNPVNENDFNRFVPADTTIEYKIRNLEYDTEPDLFFFNFNGYTGKFVFDGNGGILLMPQQKLKIIPKSQGIADIESWEVITEDGVHYCFGDTSATEVTHEISGIGTPMPNFNSSWYLKRIISADLTDTITFTYTKSTYGYSLPVSESANYNEVNNSYNVNGILIRGIQITGRQLDKIESATCIAKFIKTNLRSDLSEKRLDEIKIQDKSLNTVKHYKLYYNYWGTDKYLRLDSIDDDLSNSGAYKFEYYNTNNLPGRLSKSQDHWGFYNGKSNTTLIPSHGTFVGANRVPAWPEMKANILEKIIYPTGGYSLLTYEPHIFGHLGTISVNTVKYVIGKIDSISGSRPPNTVPCVKVIDTVPFSHYAVVNYYFKYVTDVLGSVSIERNGTEIWGRTINCATGDVCGTVTEDGVEYTTVYGTDSVFLASRSSHSLIVMPHVGQYAKLIIITKDTVSLPGAISKNSMAGGLRIKSRKDYNGLTDSTFVEYDYSMDSDTLRSSGCLVFIPRYSTPMDGPDFTLYTNELSTGYIKLYSSPSSYLGTTQGGHVGYGEVTVKYGRGGTNGKSKSYFYAPYDYTDGIEYYTPEPLVTSCDWKRGLLYRQIDRNKNNVIIRQMENTYQLDDTRTRKVARGFKYVVKSTYSICFAPVNSVVVTIPSYVIDINMADCTVKGYTNYTSKLTVSFGSNQCFYMRSSYLYGSYKVISAWTHPTRQVITTYDPNGANPVTTTQDFYYDNPYHLQLTRSMQTTSKGEQILSYNKYPLDYSRTITVVDSMVSKHIHSPVIESQVWRRATTQATDSTLIGGNITQFALYSNKILPQQSYAIESNSTLTRSLFGTETKSNGLFTQIIPNSTWYKAKDTITYYTNGNLKEYKMKDDVVTTTIWGYNKTLPVATVIGYSATEIESITGILCDNYNETNANNLRTSLPNGMVTTYTHYPLVGLKTVTNPNGVKVTYQYDQAKRLKYIKDQDDKVLKRYDYHYKGQ